MENNKNDHIKFTDEFKELNLEELGSEDCGFLKLENNSIATRSMHLDQEPDKWEIGSPIALPIVMSSTYEYQKAPQGVYVYSRVGSVTRNTLESVLASLEGAKHASTFGSGMGAISTIFNLLNAGDHVVTTNDLYATTHTYLKKIAVRLNITSTFVEDCTDNENIMKAFQPNTKMVFIESPTNPRMKLVDISALTKMVHERDKDVIIVMDNTFLTPFFQRPLSLGVDVVMHSVSKYLNGHTDVVMGCTMTNRDNLGARIRFLQENIGAVPSPFDCFLVNRGLKTFRVRMMNHMKNGLIVARFLEKHPAVKGVLHPGLPSHPQHELAKRQSYGHSGMMSFLIKGGEKEATIFVNSVKMLTHAPSWGGYETLVNYPYVTMAHLGIEPNLIRLSIGLEDPEDLLADFDQALKKAMEAA